MSGRSRDRMSGRSIDQIRERSNYPNSDRSSDMIGNRSRDRATDRSWDCIAHSGPIPDPFVRQILFRFFRHHQDRSVLTGGAM